MNERVREEKFRGIVETPQAYLAAILRGISAKMNEKNFAELVGALVDDIPLDEKLHDHVRRANDMHKAKKIDRTVNVYGARHIAERGNYFELCFLNTVFLGGFLPAQENEPTIHGPYWERTSLERMTAMQLKGYLETIDDDKLSLFKDLVSVCTGILDLPKTKKRLERRRNDLSRSSNYGEFLSAVFEVLQLQKKLRTKKDMIAAIDRYVKRKKLTLAQERMVERFKSAIVNAF